MCFSRYYRIHTELCLDNLALMKALCMFKAVHIKLYGARKRLFLRLSTIVTTSGFKTPSVSKEYSNLPQRGSLEAVSFGEIYFKGQDDLLCGARLTHQSM